MKNEKLSGKMGILWLHSSSWLAPLACILWVVSIGSSQVQVPRPYPGNLPSANQKIYPPIQGGDPLVGDGSQETLPSPSPLMLTVPMPIQVPGPICNPPEGLPTSPSAAASANRSSLQIGKDLRQFVNGTIDPQNTLDVILGRSRLLVLNVKPRRVQLEPDDKSAVVAFTLVTDTEISLVGKQLGTASLTFWFTDPQNAAKDKILSYLVRVVPDFEGSEQAHEWQERFYKALEKEINKAFCNSRVCLQLVANNLVVSGEAKDSVEATQIFRIVSANTTRSVRDTATIGPGQVSVTSSTTDANLTGSSTTQTTVTQPGEPGLIDPGLVEAGTVLGVGGQFRAGGQGINVINHLHIPGEQQVMLKVTVAEVNRAAARSIGINFSIFNEMGTRVFANQTGGIASGAGPGNSSTGGGGANLPVILDNGGVNIAINALRTLDFARTLAEPNLVTMNGHPANFRAGGEFPVPVVTGFTAAGLQGVSFVPFGVQLSFTPYITDRNLIRLNVNADVSTKDLASSATVGGTNVPGLSSRNFQTTVELREGQTLAVAGLIQNNFGADSTRVPFFGDLPIVGRLFAFDRTSAGEQELVVLVTPELVHPVNCQEAPPLPGSDLFEPGDLEFYLLGRLESRRNYDYRSPVRTDLARMQRYRRCEQIYINGPQGHSDGKP